MPRYRFNWANLPTRLLDTLVSDLGLEGDPQEALRLWYGARPKPNFIQDAWPTLLETWLADDPAWARHVAARLRTRNVGDTSQSSDLAYLRSVRNTSGLRQCVLDVFIEFGELTTQDRVVVRAVHDNAISSTPLATPVSPSSPAVDVGDGPREDGGAQPGASGESSNPSLFEFVAAVLAERLDAVQVDVDGDFVVPHGSSVTYVQVLNEPPAVRLFAVLLRDVAPSPRVYELVNSINCKGLIAGRALYVEGAVVLEHNLLPMALGEEELFITLKTIATAADHFDDLLQREIGGILAGHEPVEGEIEV